MGLNKILIVDDEKETLGLLEKKLAEKGYEVIKASTGNEAIEQTKKFYPDLILMDILLPDLDGPEVVKVLGAEPLTKSIPVIFLSGIINQGEDGKVSQVVVNSRRYQAIPKPFTFQRLLEEIGRMVELRV